MLTDVEDDIFPLPPTKATVGRSGGSLMELRSCKIARRTGAHCGLLAEWMEEPPPLPVVMDDAVRTYHHQSPPPVVQLKASHWYGRLLRGPRITRGEAENE